VVSSCSAVQLVIAISGAGQACGSVEQSASLIHRTSCKRFAECSSIHAHMADQGVGDDASSTGTAATQESGGSKKAAKILMFGKAHQGPRRRRRKKQQANSGDRLLTLMDPVLEEAQEGEQEQEREQEQEQEIMADKDQTTVVTRDVSTINVKQRTTRRRHRRRSRASKSSTPQHNEQPQEQLVVPQPLSHHTAWPRASRLPLVNAEATAANAALSVLGGDLEEPVRYHRDRAASTVTRFFRTTSRSISPTGRQLMSQHPDSSRPVHQFGDHVTVEQPHLQASPSQANVNSSYHGAQSFYFPSSPRHSVSSQTSDSIRCASKAPHEEMTSGIFWQDLTSKEHPVSHALEGQSFPDSVPLEHFVSYLAQALPNPENSKAKFSPLLSTGCTPDCSDKDSVYSTDSILHDGPLKSRSLSSLDSITISKPPVGRQAVGTPRSSSQVRRGDEVASSKDPLHIIYNKYDREREVRVSRAIAMAEAERQRRIKETEESRLKEKAERAQRLEWAINATEKERRRQTRRDRKFERRSLRSRQNCKKRILKDEEEERSWRIRQGAKADIVLAAQRRAEEATRDKVGEYSEEQGGLDGSVDSSTDSESDSGDHEAEGNGATRPRNPSLDETGFTDDYELVCPYTILGCDKTCLRSELDKHLQDCSFRAKSKDIVDEGRDEEYRQLYNPLKRLVQCPYNVVGCERVCSRAMLPEHLLHCSFQDDDAEGVDMFNFTVAPEDVFDFGSYFVVCPYTTMGCTEAILRSEVESHLTICAFAPTTRKEEEDTRYENQQLAIAAAEDERRRRVAHENGPDAQNLRAEHYKRLLQSLLESQRREFPARRSPHQSAGLSHDHNEHDKESVTSKESNDSLPDAPPIAAAQQAVGLSPLAQSTQSAAFSPSLQKRLHSGSTTSLSGLSEDLPRNEGPPESSSEDTNRRQGLVDVPLINNKNAEWIVQAVGIEALRRQLEHSAIQKKKQQSEASVPDHMFSGFGIEGYDIAGTELEPESRERWLSRNNRRVFRTRSSPAVLRTRSSREAEESPSSKFYWQNETVPFRLELPALSQTRFRLGKSDPLFPEDTGPNVPIRVPQEIDYPFSKRYPNRCRSVSPMKRSSNLTDGTNFGGVGGASSVSYGRSLQRRNSFQRIVTSAAPPSAAPPHVTLVHNHIHAQLESLKNRLDADLRALEEECSEGMAKLNSTVEEVRLRVAKVASLCFGCKTDVVVFGSFATGLAVPKLSDLDLVIFGQPEQCESNGAPLCRVLGKVICNADWVSEVKVLDKAKVPVVKLVTKLHNLNVDLTIAVPTHSGIAVADFVKELVKVHEGVLAPLVCVLKKTLEVHGFCNPFTGGLGSYALVLMIVASLNQSKERQRRVTDHVRPDDGPKLGEHLLDFLHFFGREFDARQDAVVLAPSKHGPSKRTMRIGKRYHAACNRDAAGAGAGLMVDDPVQPGNNVGATCFRFNDVQNKLAEVCARLLAYTVRCEVIDSAENEDVPVSLVDQLLLDKA